MYDVGFGDCFLVEFPRPAAPPFRILVDCGAHRSGYPRPGWTPADAVRAIVADLGVGPRLDVVVATHRHQDHVSGFSSDIWRDVEVGEVWMPWTENPDDGKATAIRERQSRLALGLQLAFATSDFAARWTDPGRADSLAALALNSLTNESAMRTLHRGFLGNPDRRFLAAGTESPIEQPACPGLTVHILGPSRDPDVIRDMDPPSGQSYLRFLGTAPGARSAEARVANHGPFARHFTLPAADHEASGYGIYVDADMKDAAVGAMRADDFAAAVSLDKAVNGTSLMLLFEFRGAFLLFPGDAQWGTWNAVMRDPASRDLLARTTYYKVGHHGSHNATPVEFLEEVLPSDSRMWGAAASVHPVKAWPEIPRVPLLTKLHEHADRVVRSDEPEAGIAGIEVRPGIGIDFHIPVAR